MSISKQVYSGLAALLISGSAVGADKFIQTEEEFVSADAAALTFYTEYEQVYRELKRKNELVAFILEDNGKFYYTTPVVTRDSFDIPAKIHKHTPQARVWGLVHTHPKKGGEKFSASDVSMVHSPTIRVSYIRTAKGDVRYLTSELAAVTRSGGGSALGKSLCEGQCFEELE